jgi:hypothetical protein
METERFIGSILWFDNIYEYGFCKRDIDGEEFFYSSFKYNF